MRIKNLTEGLNAQQRSVPQLPAQARARKISVLGAKTDPQHPFAGYAVGADEAAEPGRKSIGPDPNDPYQKGWRAGFRHDESNPYPAGSEKAAQWDKGYAEAEAQPDYYNEAVAGKVEPIQELSSDALDRYKAKAKKSSDDLTSQGKYRQANDRTMNVMKATGKQIDKTATNIRKALNRESVDQDMAEDDVADFLARGGKITQVKPNRGPRNPGLSLGSRHIGGGGDGARASRTGRGSRPQGKPVVAVESDVEEGWKSKLAGAALAGAAALGGGAAVAHDHDNYGHYDQRVDDRSWDTAGYDDHIKSDTKLTKTTTPDGQVKRDSQHRISSVQGPNAQGLYRVFVGQNGKIVSSYVTKTPPQNWMVKEDVTKEDIITKLKARLGDYLSDIGQEIRKDPDLINKLAAKPAGDQMGPPVKTVTTDDGHEISIHGNEDDGFRISIKNRQTPSQFSNLDEAVMACEMYCARRRQQAVNADYVEEA